MKISSSKKRVIISTIVLLCMVQIFWMYPNFVENKGNLKFIFIIFCLSLVFSYVKFEFQESVKGLLSIGTLIILPFVLFSNLQKPLGAMSFLNSGAMIRNVGLLLIIELVLFLLINRTRIVGIIMTIGLLFLSFLNMFIYYFRGRPIAPTDIHSLKTAMGVASNYSVWLNDFVVKDILFLFFFLILFLQFDFRVRKWMRRGIVTAISCLLIIICFLTVYQIDNLKEKSFTLQQFVPIEGVKTNGYILDFYLNMQGLSVSKPEGYSEEKIETLLEEQTKELTKNENIPNIIIIMNESFCDMSSLGEISYSEEPLAFFNSLEENTIRGNLMSSVFGGNTPNSEFECLTGGTLAFFPKDIIVYQQYLFSKIPSTISQLSKLGYETLAIHPYNKIYWDRNRVYPDVFGFDEFISEESMENPIRVREYISDQEVFEILLDRMKNDETGESLFNFTITMQNHGGYYFGMKDVTAPEIDNAYVNEYLSLMKITDEAFEEFLKELENFEEPTVVCMFGDHQPRFEDSVYETIWENSSYSEAEKEIRKHMVPFVIWANYDIEEKEIPLTSINYLSPMIFETAGIELSPYYEYLLELQKKYPSISALGCMDSEGNFYSRGDEMDQLSEIQTYRMVQYNYFHDENNRNEKFFGLIE